MIEVDWEEIRNGYNRGKTGVNYQYSGPEVWCPECGCDQLDFHSYIESYGLTCTKCVWGTNSKDEKTLVLPLFCDYCGSEKLYNSNEDQHRCVYCP